MTGLDNRVESLDSLSLQAWSQKAVISLTFRGVEHIHLIVARLAKSWPAILWQQTLMLSPDCTRLAPKKKKEPSHPPVQSVSYSAFLPSWRDRKASKRTSLNTHRPPMRCLGAQRHPSVIQAKSKSNSEPALASFPCPWPPSGLPYADALQKKGKREVISTQWCINVVHAVRQIPKRETQTCAAPNNTRKKKTNPSQLRPNFL